MLKIGQKIKITVEKIITGGDGLGHYRCFVVMVPYSAPADVLLVEITSVKRNFARARIISVISPSPYRIIPPCPSHFSLSCLAGRQDTSHRLYCGGCNFQMMGYSNQIKEKASILKDFFAPVKPETIPAADCFRYRNKIQMPLGGTAGKVMMGFYHPQSHKIVDLNNCILQSETANMIIAELRNLVNEYKIQPYNEDRHSGILRHIILRQSAAFGKFMLIFVSKTDFIRPVNEIIKKVVKKFPQITSIHQNINPRETNVILGDRTVKLYGEKTIKEKIGDVIFEISPGSFFQVNTAQAEKLYNVIKDYAELRGNENVIDVYCGSGGISLYLARHCKNIVGIEEAGSAVFDARRNSTLNGIKNASFIRGSADYALSELEISKDSIVILDPPRIGCSQAVINSLMKHLPEKIIYTSCNPATLARDIKLMSKTYRIAGISMVDIFPQTAHIECVAKLIRC